MLKTYLIRITTCFVLLLGSTCCADQSYGLSVSDSAGTEIQVWSKKILKEYLTIPSITGHEKEAFEYLYKLCKAEGWAVEIITAEDSSYNFVASLYPLDLYKPNIVFMNHIDVVPSIEENWEYAPYSAKEVDGKIFGRGALDMKGQAVMQIAALKKIMPMLEEGEEAPYNISILFVSGEETGGQKGAAIVAETYLDRLNPSVILGEGGSGIPGIVPRDPSINVFGISVAEKKNVWLRLDLNYNTFGHSAAPPENYVNLDMIRALNRVSSYKRQFRWNKVNRRMFRELGRIEGGIKGLVIRKINWDIFRPLLKRELNKQPLLASLLSNTTLLTNVANPPNAPNVLSDHATAYLDCRLMPNVNTKKFVNQLRNRLDEPRISLTIIDESVDAKPTKPGFFYDMLKESVLHFYPKDAVMPILFPATTDNNYFRAKDIPVYGLMPMPLTFNEMGTIHSSNEYLEVNKFYTGIDVYTEFILRCQKETTSKKRRRLGFSSNEGEEEED